MKKKIGEILLAHKVIFAEDIGGALALQADGDPNRLGEILLQQGRLGADALARALAEQKALPYTELSLVSSSFAQKLPLSFQHRHGLVPFEELSPGAFCIAVADPTATDAIERAKHWLNAKSIQLYVASPDEIGRVLLAMEDQQLASGEIVAEASAKSADVSEESVDASETERTQQHPALSEEDLFGSLKFDEEEPESEPSLPAQKGKSPPPAEQPLSAAVGSDELTQIVKRPGPPSETNTLIEAVETREKTPILGSSATLPSLSPLETKLSELLVERGPEALVDVVIGLADLLVSKSVLTREEVFEIFASPPAEKQ